MMIMKVQSKWNFQMPILDYWIITDIKFKGFPLSLAMYSQQLFNKLFPDQ